MAKQAMLATVHILINVNGADKDAADQASDVLRELLTDNGLLRGAILDWSFLPSPDGDLRYPHPVEVPDDYDRDEVALPYIGTVTWHSLRLSHTKPPMMFLRREATSVRERAKHLAKRAQQALASFF